MATWQPAKAISEEKRYDLGWEVSDDGSSMTLVLKTTTVPVKGRGKEWSQAVETTTELATMPSKEVRQWVSDFLNDTFWSVQDAAVTVERCRVSKYSRTMAQRRAAARTDPAA